MYHNANLHNLVIKADQFMHLSGRSINSDWFVNSFIMIVYENFFPAQSDFCVQGMTKKFYFEQLL